MTRAPGNAASSGNKKNPWPGRFERAKRLVTTSPVGPVDPWLAAAVVALVGFGVVMVYSASAFDGTVRYGDPQHYLKRQGVFALLSLVVMWVTSRIDYRRLKKLTYPLLVIVVALLGLTIVGLGHRAGNAYRWLAVGPINIQPSELAKVVLVLWLAYSLSKKAEKIRTFTVGFLPHLLVVGLLMALCLKQPDFGSAVVLLLLTFTMMFISGVRVPYIVSFAALLGVLGTLAVRFSGYRYARYLSWLDMEGHRQDLAYQPFQSAMSFGSGGIFGLGLGRGLQVLYLPEAHTDFVAAIIGEELGFVGIAGMVLLFAVIVGRGVKIAFEAEDDYGTYLAFGLSMIFGLQVLINLCVAMAILPTKGLTLPFVSYGGSSLLVSAAAIGIVLSVSRRRSVVRVEVAPVGPEPSASLVVAAGAEEGS